MRDRNHIDSFLKDNPFFDTKEFADMVKENEPVYSERDAYRMLLELQTAGKIVKNGRGHYSSGLKKMFYSYESSGFSDEITGLIMDRYPMISFQTWELYQWNEFVNHQIAHNALFIEVEKGFESTIFELLLERYPRVLLNPDAEYFYRYRADDMLIVQSLISGAPSPIPGTNQASLEKLLVDIFSRKLTGQLIERAEYPKIYSEAFQKYAVNETALFRYAGRRHLDDVIRTFIKDQTEIRLWREK